jgi:hypothetical protein
MESLSLLQAVAHILEDLPDAVRSIEVWMNSSITSHT